MQLDHFPHRRDVIFGDRFRHTTGVRIAVARERSNCLRQAGALLVSFAGHNGGDCSTKCPAFHAVVTITVAHDERAEVRVAESERAENMGVLRDFFDRVTRVVHDDFLGGDENAYCRLEPFDIKVAVRSLELHQVERCEVAGGVIEEEIFRAGVGGILPVRAFAGVPFVDRGIELHPRVAADMCSFGDLAQQGMSIFALAWLAVANASCPPLATFERCFHELITHPHAQIFILVHDRAVRVAVVTAVVTLLDQRPRFFFFFLLRVDEFLNVGMPILECVHLGGTPRFAAALHHIRNLIVNL